MKAAWISLPIATKSIALEDRQKYQQRALALHICSNRTARRKVSRKFAMCGTHAIYVGHVTVKAAATAWTAGNEKVFLPTV